MKRKQMMCMVAALCMVASLVGCGSTTTDKTTNKSTEKSTEKTSENVEDNVDSETSQNEKDTEVGTVIKPMDSGIDIEHLEDCTVAVSLEEGDFYLDDDGKAQMKVTAYGYDEYDMVDIANMKEGDCIILHGEEVVVQSLERTDAALSINGGVSEGGYDLVSDESSVFFEKLENDSKYWKELGTVTLPVNESFTYEDNSNLDDGVKTWYAGDFLQQEPEIKFGFTPLDTTITIQNGEVISMVRVFVP